MSALALDLIRLGEQLAAENNAAHDLWTWLPSYKVAQRHHGNYASNHCPSNEDVMTEATLYISLCLLQNTPTAHTSPAVRARFEQCPCGDDHERPDGG
jgi:hypothetical protein